MAHISTLGDSFAVIFRSVSKSEVLQQHSTCMLTGEETMTTHFHLFTCKTNKILYILQSYGYYNFIDIAFLQALQSYMYDCSFQVLQSYSYCNLTGIATLQVLQIKEF